MLQSFKSGLKALYPWMVPRKLEEALKRHVFPWLYFGSRLKFVRRNQDLRGLHAGKRCFILCSGPSIGKEDLSGLENEICFSVSYFYRHPQYRQIRPQYHCITDFHAHTDEEIEKWFLEIDASIADATLFLGAASGNLVEKRQLFPGREVRYVAFGAGNHPDRGNVDISSLVSIIQSVPIMCLMIALHMGFKEIYLLGTDHDDLRSGKYLYFFDRKEIVAEDPTVDSSGRSKVPRTWDLNSYLTLFRQYECIKSIADSRAVKIHNLAQGSFLDVFPMGSLSEVLKRSQ